MKCRLCEEATFVELTGVNCFSKKKTFGFHLIIARKLLKCGIYNGRLKNIIEFIRVYNTLDKPFFRPLMHLRRCELMACVPHSGSTGPESEGAFYSTKNSENSG